MPHRRRTGGVCPGAVCRPRAEPHSRYRERRAGPACGDVLATGYWAARISEIGKEDTVLIIGAGPTGICTLLCVMLKQPRRIIVCEKSPERIRFVREHYPDVLVTGPKECEYFVLCHSDHGGADVVLEVAGTEDTFTLAWECARPNAVVTIVALYDKPQMLPLPEMYGKNLTFKTGGGGRLRLRRNTKPDRSGKDRHHTPDHAPVFAWEDRSAYRIFENRLDGGDQSGRRVREVG